MKQLLSILVLFALSGCGGFRGGIESVPCLGACLPIESTEHRSALHEVALPEISLSVSLNNRLRTYQYEVMLYVIPTYLNFWDEFQHRDAESLELTLQVTAHDADVTIDPRQLVLTVDGQALRPSAVWVNNRERERHVIAAYLSARRRAPSDPPPPIPRAAEWRDAVTAPVTVHRREQSPRFIVVFPTPLTSPDRPLSLSVSPAIGGPLSFDVPLIHFQPRRWSESYS